jgi:hypothetical protein
VSRFSLKGAIIVLCCGLQVHSAMAICPFPRQRIRTQFTRSEVAFIGTVLSESGIDLEGKKVSDPTELVPLGYAAYLCYQVKTVHIYRGVNNNVFKICEGNDSSRMGLQIGQTYLFLIERNKNGMLLGSCADAINSRGSDYAKKLSDVEEVIQNISVKAYGDILGFVGSTEGSVSDGLGGIHFLVKGMGVTRTVVSDKGGWFHVPVPAGLYKIEPFEPNYKIEATIYSPDSPDHIDVRVAGGAEVSFVAKPNN